MLLLAVIGVGCAGPDSLPAAVLTWDSDAVSSPANPDSDTPVEGVDALLLSEGIGPIGDGDVTVGPADTTATDDVHSEPDGEAPDDATASPLDTSTAVDSETPLDVAEDDASPSDTALGELEEPDVFLEELPVDVVEAPDLEGPDVAIEPDLEEPDLSEPDIPPTPVCGDSQMDTGEACDDGNPWSGDGCSPACISEGPWVDAYFEDFSDGKSQGWNIESGGCGDADNEEVDGVEVWVLSSDWQSMMRDSPEGLSSLRAFETRVRLVNDNGTATVAFRAKQNSGATVDYSGYNAYLSSSGGVSLCATAACESVGATTVPVGTWMTLRVEEDLAHAKWRYSLNGVWMAEGSTAGVPLANAMMELHANGQCDNDRLQIAWVRVQHKP